MKTTILSLAISLGFLITSVRAMRRNHLGEHIALMWLSVSLVMVVLSATLPFHLVDWLSKQVGIAYPPAMILLLAVVFLLLLVFQLSLSLSQMATKQTRLVQELALLTVPGPTEMPGDAAAEPFTV
jgi:hypothetical protein